MTEFPIVGVGVMVIKIIDNKTYVLVHKRNSKSKNEGGKFGFPGGTVDSSDPSTEYTAYRELEEEVSVTKQDILSMKHISRHMTPKGGADTFVAVLKKESYDKKFDPKPEFAKEIDGDFGTKWLSVGEIEELVKQDKLACFCVCQFEKCKKLIS